MNTFDSIHQKIIDVADNVNEKSVLEFGCGKGGLIKQLMPGYKKILAVDINKDALKLTESNNSQLVKNKKLELKLLQSPRELEECFDTIFCHNVIENFSNRVEFVNDIHKLLNDKGTFVLSNLDFDSAIFNHTNIHLTRELLCLFSDYKQDWMKNHDGQIGRKLRGIVESSLFSHYELKSYLISETQYNENCLGYNMSNWIFNIASGRYDSETLNNWLKEFKRLESNNDYFFSINLMIIKAIND